MVNFFTNVPKDVEPYKERFQRIFFKGAYRPKICELFTNVLKGNKS